MRTRAEIEAAAKNGVHPPEDALALEVLLDIRDLLARARRAPKPSDV